MKDYSHGYRLTKRQRMATRTSLILLLLLTMMTIATVITTTMQTAQSITQQNTNHSNPTKEGIPPTDPYWARTYGGTGTDIAYSVQQTADGDYIVAGRVYSFGADSADAWLLKLNSAGSVTWQKTYGGSSTDGEWSVQQTADGGYVVAGYASSFGAGGSDAWVVKLVVGGDIVWDAGSGASTYITSVTPSDSDATISTTSVTPVSSAATVQDTHVTPQDTNATVAVQSPDIFPPAAITDLAASSPTTTNITLTWTAPGDSGVKGNATGYVVKYSTIGQITAANWSSATTYAQSWTPAKNGTAETHVVTGLAPGTKYWFAIEAFDKASNYGSLSNSPSGTTTTQGIPLVIILGGVAVAVIVVVLVAIMLMKKKKT